MRFAFLLGAGVSIPAGMPRTSEITDTILARDQAWKTSQNIWYLDPDVDPDGLFTEEPRRRINPFLAVLKNLVDESKAARYDPRQTDYEDLYYLAAQIEDDLLGDYENPGLLPLEARLLTQMQEALDSLDGLGGIAGREALRGLAEEVGYYIRDVLWQFLLRDPTTLGHLDFIGAAAADPTVSELDIFTLNHDMLIETYLEERTEIEYVDGFGQAIRGIRYWQPSVFERWLGKLRLFKLHGSVNWYRFNRGPRIWPPLGIPTAAPGDYRETIGPAGQPQTASRRPEILAGTFNKMLRYSSDFYADLLHRFRRRLADTDWLLVSGYSFGDKGVNTQVVEWMYKSASRKIIVITPDPESLRQRSRYRIENDWPYWEQQGRLVPISSGIESISWEEIKQLAGLV